MPLHSIGWTTEEELNLVELVKPHTHLYDSNDPSRKSILAREVTWQKIGKALNKPVEECKKRWRCLRDGYTRSKRHGAMHKTKQTIMEKLQFLSKPNDEEELQFIPEMDSENTQETVLESQQVITDNQEYYEITVVDTVQGQRINSPFNIQKPHYVEVIQQPTPNDEEPPKKIVKTSKAGRKKSVPLNRNIPPVKILPKPLIVNRPNIVRYVENPKTHEQRSEVIDKLIEKILKENTNEIDVFFRSMATSVKKLHPNLIPKVKMEVCNVIAKYEMQSFSNKPPQDL